MPETDLETFYWNSQLRYKCPITWEGGARCEFDHYDPDVVHRHMMEPHNYTGKGAQPTAPSTVVQPAKDYTQRVREFEEHAQSVRPEFDHLKFRPEK